MKIVKGKLFELALQGYTFLVLTTERHRAYQFFIKVFPEENITDEMIVKKYTVISRESLKEIYCTVRKAWEDLNLLEAALGTIKFDRPALDALLEHTNELLTNL